MTNNTKPALMALIVSSLLAVTSAAQAYDSGSTGADGAFAPQVDTTLQLPEDGIFNYTSFTVPNGVTVDFEKNTTNTPVIILASGDVTIAGTLTVSGTNGTDVGPKGDGNIGDDALPGLGGPGGYDGGTGGTSEAQPGGNGLGPGGGPGAVAFNTVVNEFGCGGAGGGYAGNSGWSATNGGCSAIGVGQSYGTPQLQPLLGGSGGGGGYASTSFAGGGGGGGGGAILIASSQTVNVTGALTAIGGLGGDSAGLNSGGVGGSASGGAIRIIATTIAGNGTISADGRGGVYHDQHENTTWARGGNASDGRIRLEAESITRTAATLPAYNFSGPEPIFLANIPGVRITTVAGIAVPASPTGAGDVVVPEVTPNPVTIEFTTTNIPVGNTIELTLTPQSGANSSAVSSAITGTDQSGTASLSIDIPDGPSTLSAQVTFTVAIAGLQADYSQFAKGEKVEKIRVDFDQVNGSMTTFIASTGNEYTWPSNTVAIN